MFDLTDANIAYAIDTASDLVRVLPPDLTHNLDRNRDLEHTLASARAFACAHDLASAHACALNLAYALARALETDRGRKIDGRAFLRAQTLVAELERYVVPAHEPNSEAPEPTAIADQQTQNNPLVGFMSPLATHLANAALCLLPYSDRSRYAEEYESELHELALISCRAQRTYAVRLLVCSPMLRRELRRDAREAAGG